MVPPLEAWNVTFDTVTNVTFCIDTLNTHMVVNSEDVLQITSACTILEPRITAEINGAPAETWNEACKFVA